MFGFDFGTTHSKVAYIDQAGKPAIILNNRGDPTTPSALYLQDPKPPLVGKDALEQGYVDPANSVRNWKLRLGSTESLLSNGKIFTPTDAAALLICRLKEDAERQLGIQVQEAVATYPANFRNDSQQALEEAYALNGIKILRLVPEPTAAGTAYALSKQGRKDLTYGVFDFGGGTFDASIQRVDGDQVTTLATEGIPQCGGNDLNDCLKKMILDEVEAKFGQRPTPQTHPLFFYDLEQKVEAAKISLGNREEVPIVVVFDGSQIIRKVLQVEFHKAIEPIVQQTLEAVDKAAAAAGLTMDQIALVIMVGGTSRSPYVQEALARHIGKQPKFDVDPERAIAYGAAYISISELAQQGKTVTIRGQVIPAPDMFARDVTAHAVGCCVVDTTGPNKRLVNSVIIQKNTPIPCRKSDQFHLEHEDQTEARIEVLQGEANADREKCLLIGERVLTDLPTEDKRSRRISVEYVIDANGMINVTAKDMVSGKQQTISVDYKKGLTPKQKPDTA